MWYEILVPGVANALLEGTQAFSRYGSEGSSGGAMHIYPTTFDRFGHTVSDPSTKLTQQTSTDVSRGHQRLVNRRWVYKINNMRHAWGDNNWTHYYYWTVGAADVTPVAKQESVPCEKERATIRVGLMNRCNNHPLDINVLTLAKIRKALRARGLLGTSSPRRHSFRRMNFLLFLRPVLRPLSDSASFEPG